MRCKYLLPHNDDAQGLPLNGNIIFNIDGFSAKYVKMDFMDYSDVGWRGAVASVSDLVAKLAKPIGILFSVTARTKEIAEDISRGVFQFIEEYSLCFLGADTNRGEEVIDVAAIGIGDNPPPRSGAKEGDYVVVFGRYWGYTYLCLKGYEEFYWWCKRPKLDLALPEKMKGVKVNASMDSSDGLAYTLWSISEASGVKIIVEPPLIQEVWDASRELGLPYEEVIFYSGEEYHPVMTMPEESLRELEGRGLEFFVIGKVERGSGVYCCGKQLRKSGWEWF